MDITQKIEHRKYPRRIQIIPVKFQYIDENGQPTGDVYQGFTRNVAKGGLSIQSEIKRGKGSLELIPDKTKLKLIISIPEDAPPIHSIVTVKWSTKVSEPGFDTYFFGVRYDQIDNTQQLMIERHIKRLRKKPKVFLYFYLLLAALIIVFTYFILVKR